MQHNLRVREHGLFLQCMADNIHADRKTFRGVIKLLQRIHDRVEKNEPIQKILLEFFGSAVMWGDLAESQQSQDERMIRTLLLHIINQLDNIITGRKPTGNSKNCYLPGKLKS